VPGSLERYQLPAEVQERLEELRELSKKAEAGDTDARNELKQAVRESAPEVIARASDVGRRAQHLLIETASGGNLLTHYALSGRLDAMREEVAGENPTPLEVLLTERVVACWMLVQLFDALMAGQLWKGAPSENRIGAGALRHYLRWQDLANRRFLAAVQALARVRKLQANTPGVQFNTQINVSRD
jgi:formamidopyrimidine-DNA glycosylase